MRFEEMASRAGKAAARVGSQAERPAFGQVLAARQRRTLISVVSAAVAAALAIFGVVVMWAGSGAPSQPATSTIPIAAPGESETTIPSACGDSLPLLATVVPDGSDELDPEGAPGPGPDSLPVEENQLVSHWAGELGVVIEMRWPATSYLDEPESSVFEVAGKPASMAPRSSADDNLRVVAQIRLSDNADDACSLLSVDGYGPRIDPVYDQVRAFAEGLVDEEGYNEFLAAIAELEERRGQEVFCDQPSVDVAEGEMVVTLYEICDQGMDTGNRVLSGLQPVDRVIDNSDDPLRAAVEALVGGPTRAETTSGFSSFFSEATTGAVLSVSIENGVVVVDLDAERIETLNNVSTTTGGSYFLGQLYGTIFANVGVESADIRLDGESARLCTLMQSVPDCQPITRSQWDQNNTATWDNDLGIDPQVEDVDIRGRWVLTEYSVHGARHPVVVGVNARQIPWIEVGEYIEGDLGCNILTQGETRYSLDGNGLYPGEFWTTAARCASNLMAVEEAFHQLRSNGVIRVDVAGKSMTWSTLSVSMSFEASD